MSKMDDDTLLAHLRSLEQDSAAFTWGRLGSERERAMKEYFRQPYGTEQEGWSSIVTSEVQDTVEWILPSLLKIFTSTDQAVSFEPTKAEDVKAAEQATDTCNYVFYKQNNGFLTLYTAFKDALLVKNCAVMWRKETKRTKEVTPANGATAEMLAMLLDEAGADAEIEAATPQPLQPVMGPQGPVVDPMTGQPAVGPQLYNARIASYKEKTTIEVEAFAPEDLLVKRDWTLPLLNDCPYVARNMRVTLSDIHEMGFPDVTADDVFASNDVAVSADASFRLNRANSADMFTDRPVINSDDESRTEGFLRLEFVLVDYDGDGISERRCIYRLKDKILSNEECAQVPIATASPILVPHRWDGMSVAETVSDLQQLKTELTRQMLNSAYLANNPRTEVLTDANGTPYANIDDLLDSRPGGVLRKTRPDALGQNIIPFVGGQMLPVLAYVDEMGERRTGVSKAQQGIDSNALRNDRTAVEVMQTANAAQSRIELIARIFAETLLKPIFQGILKLLTEGEMEKIAFRLRNEFVEYDPNEWRDSYDMTINVGLGTGDKQQQQGALQAIFQNQMGLAQSPFGQLLISPDAIYHTQAKLVENAGFKNVGDFFQDPKGQQVPPPQPNPQLQIEQGKLQQGMQLKQMELQYNAQAGEMQRNQEAQLEQMRQQMQQQTDNNRQEMEARQQQMKLEMEAQLHAMKAQYDDARHMREMEFKRWQAELDASVRIETANISSKAKLNDAATQTATNEIASEVQQ